MSWLFCLCMPENITWNRCLMATSRFKWNHQALIMWHRPQCFCLTEITCYLLQQPVVHFILNSSFRFYCLPLEFQLPSERNVQQARQSCVFTAVYWVSLWDGIFSPLDRYVERGNVHRGLEISWEKPVLHYNRVKCIQVILFSLNPFQLSCLVLSGGSNKVMLALL